MLYANSEGKVPQWYVGKPKSRKVSANKYYQSLLQSFKKYWKGIFWFLFQSAGRSSDLFKPILGYLPHKIHVGSF
jgi:hypothetical protein